MSKDIWHTKDEIPRQESRVVWKSGNVICGGRFDTYYKCFCGPASQFIDLKRVSRWAYLDDLLALEAELERTHKALDVKEKQVEISKKALSFINENWDNADCGRKELGACAFNAIEDISAWEEDIAEIKQITAEQKE